MAIICVGGASGSGKTTLVEKAISEMSKRKVLSQERLFQKQITCTTREPRKGERYGVDYNFMSKEAFERGIKNGEFVEYTCYAGNYYGTRFEDIEKNREKNVFIVMDVAGAKAIQSKFPERTRLVFVDRPKYECIMSVLERKISNEEKTKRIVQYDRDYESWDKYDVILPNKNLDTAVTRLCEIAESIGLHVE